MARMFTLLIAFAAAVLTAYASPTSAADRWETYVNTRYGVIIDYPADVFAIQPAPPDNAGRSFQAPPLKARFGVYSHANALDQTLAQLKDEDAADLGDKDATIQQGADWYQILGVKEDEFIIRRVVLSVGDSMVHRLEIAFPARAAGDFAPIAERMSKSFRVDPAIPDKAAAKAAGGGRAETAATPAQATAAAATQTKRPGAAAAERLDSGEWRVSIPSARAKDLPALRADRDEIGDSTLGNVAFVCDRDRYYILLISPLFAHGRTDQGRVSLVSGEADYATSFRDLYASRDALGRKIDWDATILYSEVPKTLLTLFTDGSTLRIEVGARAWTIELKAITAKVRAFLKVCEAGRTERGR